MKFMGKIIRRFQSASLVTQMMLAVLFALIIAQGLSLMILGSAYRTVLSDINQKARFQQVQSLIHLLEESPQEDYQAILSAVRSKGVWFNISKNSSVSSDVMTLADKRLVNKLTEQLGDEYKNKVLISILRLPDKRGGRPTDQENEVSKECQWGDPDCYKFFREKRDRGDHKHYAMRAPKLISLKNIHQNAERTLAESEGVSAGGSTVSRLANHYLSVLFHFFRYGGSGLYGAQNYSSNGNAG